MSAAPLTEPCPTCHGKGAVPQPLRRQPDGSPDPFALQQEKLCDRCGATGRVPVDPKTIVERKPGFLADAI